MVFLLAIEKMTLIDINGNTAYLDRALILCLGSGKFQPEHATKLSEYSIGENPLLRNPYGGILVKIGEIANQLNIPLGYVDFSSLGMSDRDRERLLAVADQFLDTMRTEYPGFFVQQRQIRDEIVSYTSAVDMLSHVNQEHINFDTIWQNQFLQIRFGRLPTARLPHLVNDEDNLFEMIKLDESGNTTWCLYFTADEYGGTVDKMFASNGFERLRVPDFVHGTAGKALGSIRESLEREQKKLEENDQQIQRYVSERQEALLMLYSKIKFLHDAYDLRRYAVIIRDHFHFIGFVPTKDKDAFLKLFEGFSGIVIKDEPAGADPRLSVPVKLRNNLFTRAFEMFVEMYGSPNYGDIDPTPFVAYTYTILFGIMFGDIGHGLTVFLVGLVMWKKMKMGLGRILQRVGVMSMFFGFWYGSIFGFEHLLDPVFRAMGFHEKPIEVMHPDTTNKILLVAVAVGVVTILSAMLFNIILGFKRRDFNRALLSSNGVCGFVFYASVLLGVVGTMMGYSLFSWWYILLLIALPLLLIFFREPISHYAHMVRKDTEIQMDTRISKYSVLEREGFDITELFSSQFMTARFGRIPTDSYRKLVFYANEPFVLYPVQTDDEYIWLLYACSVSDKPEIDAIFQDLYFERIYIPDEDMKSPKAAADFIRECVDMGGTPQSAAAAQKHGHAEITKPRTMYERLFPDGFGAFFMETFFEMFEILLSFISNTVSFLRVGGFVLVHAGMMSVVMSLSQMSSGGGSVAIIIFGNLFVMVIEGLIVGIQVLRLEFYEIFSRFYDANGDEFKPASVDYTVAVQ